MPVLSLLFPFLTKGHISTQNSGWCRKIASASRDTTVQIWDIKTGKTLQTMKHQARVNTVAWSSDGKFIASGSHDKIVQVWNATTVQQRLSHIHENYIEGIAWSPDGRRIVSSEYVSGKVHIWDIQTDNTLHIYSGQTVKVWDARTGHTLVTYKGHNGTVHAAPWSRDGRYIASSGTGDETVQIWHSDTGKHIFTYKGHSGWVEPVAWSPDGTCVASGGGDGTVQVWWAVP